MAVHRFWLPPSPTHFAQFVNALQWNDEGFRARYSGPDSPLGAGRFKGDRDGVLWKNTLTDKYNFWLVDARLQVHALPSKSWRSVLKTVAQKVIAPGGSGTSGAEGQLDYGMIHHRDWHFIISLDGGDEGGPGGGGILLNESTNLAQGAEYWFINGGLSVGDQWVIVPAGDQDVISGAGIITNNDPGPNDIIQLEPPGAGDQSYVQLLVQNRAASGDPGFIILANNGVTLASSLGAGPIDFPPGEG